MITLRRRSFPPPHTLVTDPVAAAPEAHREAWAARLRLLLSARGVPTRGDAAALTTTLASTVALRDRAEVWLVLYLLSGRLPDDATVVDVARRGEFEGAVPLAAALAELTTDDSAARRVELVADAVLVDVMHTAGADFVTGIQRVARETVRRWHRDHSCVFVSWTAGHDALRRLDPTEHRRLLDETGGAEDTTVLVPLGGTYVSPELTAEPERTGRLLALARHSGLRTGVIGFDCVPLTSSETSAPGFPSVFVRYLSAVRHYDRVAAISRAAMEEYAGWRRMLGATGLPGPEVSTVMLPADPPRAVDEDQARAMFVVGAMPMLLVVGSHEPRKNHTAVLHAAEVLWRRGHLFSLSFVGGRSWGGDHFTRRLTALQGAGRPVASLSGVEDAVLSGAYRLARFTVFPSLNEGFGLPVAESLASGTPVITSGFGSMAEIAADGGCLTVDPRDDDDLVAAMERLLTDDAVLHRLEDEAAARPQRTWDDYAAEVWDVLVGPAGGTR